MRENWRRFMIVKTNTELEFNQEKSCSVVVSVRLVKVSPDHQEEE